MAGRTGSKVPSIISYHDIQNTQLAGWGGRAHLDNNSLFIASLFKLCIDPKYERPAENMPESREARLWFRDYLKCLYEHITKHIQEIWPASVQSRWEFQFSTPTTWKDPSMIASIRSLISEAGFEASPDRKIVIGATEAEAAGIYVSLSSERNFQKDDVILVCKSDNSRALDQGLIGYR